MIEGNRSYQLADGTKLGFRKNIIKDAKMMEDVILPALEPVVNERLRFGDSSDAIIEEINEME